MQNAIPNARSLERPRKGWLRRFIAGQIALSEAFEAMLPRSWRLEGNSDYRMTFVPRYLREGLKVYDIGGGKHPHFGPVQKAHWKLEVVGLDIDPTELERAPEGLYDETVCADITRYRGRGDADLVICRALLEHVANVEEAFRTIESLLKPGGVALIFVPSRNAVFARLNLLLPQGLKEKILYGVYPDSRLYQGFPSYYDRCTPEDFRKLAGKYGLIVQKERLYYFSHYFQFLFPLHLLWRAWMAIFRLFAGRQAAETFSVALQKPLAKA